MQLVEEFKFNRCEDVFSEGDYNFELFQHSMEKIFEEERKEQEEKQRIENESKPQVSWVSWFESVKNSNFGLWFTVIFLIFSVAVLGYQYYSYSASGAFKFFR